IKIKDVSKSATSGITHVYAVQMVNGKEIANSVANINIDKSGNIISASATDADLAKATFTDTNDPAGNSVVQVSGLPTSFVQDGKLTVEDSYLQLEDGSLAPVWSIVADQGHSYWNAHVNKDTNKVEALSNWVSHVSTAFNVYPFGVSMPSEGSRQLVYGPEDSTASPSGWIQDSGTSGNNVYARYHPGSASDAGSRVINANTNIEGISGSKAFNYPLDISKDPQSYVEASVTQLFYTINILHDIMWHYGFNEAAGNFQVSNFGHGGKGNDPVVANAMDGSGYNNADFMTPPDGYSPRMRMFLWDRSNPKRDGSLEFDVVAHEFTHGVSNRLTGGPSNANCLVSGEAGGMGEGYSDFVAIVLKLKPGQTRSTEYQFGSYVNNGNLRRYPYSTSKQTNPTSFGYLDKPDYSEVHYIGELYCEMLYEVLWNLVDKYGISASIYSRDLSKGNSLALQLIIDSFKIQPCNPSFIDSRDALLQADVQLTGGKNMCLIWKGFAKRGLGVNASGRNGQRHTEDSSVPSGC
ncbi:hypothetical protein GQ54DRAFT_252677, partial [Martensiomyces pterosporus]